MSNMRLIIDNVHDSATLTATSEALPVAYTQRSGRAYPWRSVGTTTQVIEATLPEPQIIDSLILYRHNLSEGASVRVELLKDSVVVYDSGEELTRIFVPAGIFRVGIDAWGASYNEQIPVTVTSKWLPITGITGYRLTINDPGNPDGYIQIGRIITGKAFSPEYNPSYGLDLEWIENVEHRRTEGGSLRSIGEGLARRLAFDLNFMAEQDRARLTAEFVKRGKAKDVFISVYPESGSLKEIEHSFVARRDTNYAHAHDFYANWQTQLAFLEV